MRQPSAVTLMVVGMMVLLSACAACVPRRERNVRVIDLVHEFHRAEKRPPGATFEVAEHIVSSVRHATLSAPVPSRIIWNTAVPARGVLRAALAVAPVDPARPDVAINFRVGISDDRIYEHLGQQRVSAGARETGWIPLTIDMSRYGGWQWSLFYRPGARQWRLIFNAEPVGGEGRALWGAPGVDTDARSAQAWWRKRGGD
jgi:hypothetical protein